MRLLHFFLSLLTISLLLTLAQSNPRYAPAPSATATSKPPSPPPSSTRPVDVWLIPLEGFPTSTADELRQTFARELNLNIRMTLPARCTPDMYFSSDKLLADRVRDQLQAPMRTLPGITPRTTYVVLAPADLNQIGSEKGYVYTAHFPEQRLAIISLSRLRDAFYGTRDTPDVTRARLYKMTKMAIGAHYYHLGPTNNLDSVMYSPVETRYDLDRLGTGF
ncbi:hypothetical protein [Geminisphaera colitermitum]|uniref:hypothetical protein n=1 Tax=Geminisphaera colitermitum TaxID=1148786 RepID=UPI000158C9D3|nr:hypothetical protein [Geminisphaera colitermitum]